MLTTSNADAPVAASSISVDELILPIGQYAGSTHDVLRLGRVEPLTGDAFVLWTLAHGPLDPLLVARLPWSRMELIRYAGMAGLAGAADVAAALLRRGLLAEIPRMGPVAVDFARRHRAVPLILGLGNTAEEPDLFGLGVAGTVLVHVDEATYEVWCSSTVEESLWSACLVAAPPGGAERMLAGFLAGFHRLASANACYLDGARR